jgi:hypothetical protein
MLLWVVAFVALSGVLFAQDIVGHLPGAT